jgi:hypothetical protein
MELLALVSDINNSVSFLLGNTVTQRRHISCIIIKAAIRLLDNERNLLLGHKDANCSIILDGNTALFEFVDHGAQHRVIERLSNLL